MNNYDCLDFLFHLAKKYQVILLIGRGFGSGPWYVRVSLANLNQDAYQKISWAIRSCIEDLIGDNK